MAGTSGRDSGSRPADTERSTAAPDAALQRTVVRSTVVLCEGAEEPAGVESTPTTARPTPTTRGNKSK